MTQAELWKQSHHALAMQRATDTTVLGDFADARFEHSGIVTTFSRSGNQFLVQTDSPDGVLHEYEIAYTFGVYPLQQYLIAFSGGRFQALGIAWDSRPKEQGGQRWFHLYPNQNLKAGDRLHWTGREQTWNYQCADCHSTNLQKKYSLSSDSYATSWTDIDVSCEACHGPGSRHVSWAKSSAEGGSPDPKKGLTNWVKPTDDGHREINWETGIARRTERLASTEVETCAACHSRRKVISQRPVSGSGFLDGHLPAPLSRGLYHADGQIDGEVYEYGSFLQSRMHAAGVTCSNCHDPHSAKLLAEGNGLCSDVICRHVSTRASIIITNPPAAAANASTAICRQQPTWLSMRGTTTISGFRVRICRFRSAPRTRAISVTLIGPSSGRQRPWSAGIPGAGRRTPHYGTALHAGRVGVADAEQRLYRPTWIRDNRQSYARAPCRF